MDEQVDDDDDDWSLDSDFDSDSDSDSDSDPIVGGFLCDFSLVSSGGILISPSSSSEMKR